MAKKQLEDSAVTKKVRGRPKAAPSKVTKTKAPARRTSGRLNEKPTPEPSTQAKRGKRNVLVDKTNGSKSAEKEMEQIDETGDVTMEDAASGDELDAEVIAVKESKAKDAKKPATARGRTAKTVAPEPDVAEETVAPVGKKGRPGRKGKGKAQEEPAPEQQSPEKVIQETQVPEVEMETEVDIEEYSILENSIPEVKRKESRPYNESRRRQMSVSRHRAGSASDTERNEPAVRRRLDELIASLKANLATQTSLAKETRSLKKTIESQDALVTNLQAQINQLELALSEAQVENKTLSTKLAASRKITASYESANVKVPGSAIKANGGMRMIGSQEAAQAAQAAQLKEDLYSDLTGLIIRGVKREAEEDVFDCIQTGRNGTLHFKLGVENEKMANGDADCRYTPLLDPSRDKPLLELLPDYLVDEIEFPRPQAARFYARITRALTEKPASMGGPVDESDE
ncbi:hypothetical protein SS1G_09922 [Sclerotinia sclerotiorum 1980 UF-70]|uniref:Monopolin complex subunit Csm1/Pcs1 C-terminal domain-containing protein n=1 Tax=Sclerotinia sclerotiorum (strain ATCC 18683 / 1980 / Ss-1) TaxID=665079 RepID=A7EX62_SCLS1|nr:hypothetical protein SS1G_09922 [Sclerotinia sclerotiorum 1980 UF-70]EDN94054.1 hypothetical protein SS1G_09922 [Sclerotinia sclerotiorum 1980 UF-70]